MATALGFAVLAATPSEATTPPPTVTATLLPLPADASTTSHNTVLNSIACGAPGSCVAVGQYVDHNGTTQGLIETWSSGTWSASKAPVPSDAASNPFPIVVKVACGAAGSCVAYEGYSSTSPPFNRYALLSLSGGVWTAADFPVVAGTNPTPHGVACNAANSCTVVGSYTGTDGKVRGFVAFFHSAWTVVDAPLPIDAADPNAGDNVLSQLNAVSCSSALCLGVGQYEKSNGLYEVLVDAITPSAATANADPKPPEPTDDDHATNLSGVSCEPSGPCAGFGSYEDSSNVTHSLIEPLGSSWVHSWAPLQAPILGGDIQANSIPNLAAIACAHDSSTDGCVLAGNYADSSFNPKPLSDRLSGGTWSADTPPSSRFMSIASCGSPGFCVEGDIVNSGITDELAVLSGSTWFAASAPDPANATMYATLESTACDSATSCFAVGMAEAQGVAEHVTATSAPPSVKLTTPTAAFTLASSTKLSWSGKAGGAAITHYKVQERKAAWNGSFSAWSTPSAWSNLSAATTHVNAALSVGADTCFRVEVFDGAGHSAFSSQRCTAMPLDDKSLTASSGWSRVSASGYYRGTYSANAQLHATLSRTGAEFDRVALVVYKCPTCGKVAVSAGATQLGTIDLHATTPTRQVLVNFAKVGQRTAPVTIKVLTSGKTIRIDGLGISRS